MCIIPKMIIDNRNDQNHEQNNDETNKGKRVSKNQIQFPKQKMKHVDEVMKIMINNITKNDDNYNTTTNTDNEHNTEVASESTKKYLFK